MLEHLRWSSGLAAQAWVRFSVSGGTEREHDHDFPEWFWVESGSMRHHCDGEVEDLEVGDLVLLHPRHRHAIVPLGGPASHVVLSVEPGLFARFAQRHRTAERDWPWPQAGQGPRRRRLGPRALARMRSVIELLPLRDQRPADAELALSATLRVLRDAPLDEHGEQPPWLAAAVAALDDPGRAALGVSAFITACGRTSATVCRAVRRHHACRPAELVAAARLDHAARRLRCGDEPIEDVAAAVGYASLSHFYREFKRRFACPPAAWRASP